MTVHASFADLMDGDLEDIASDIYPWENLIVFKPSKALRKSLWRRTRGGVFQFIEDGYGDLGCDLYAVEITRMPKIDGKTVSAAALLRHIRLNINSFVSRLNTRFRPYGYNAKTRRYNKALWEAKTPTRALIHLDLINLKGKSLGVDLEDATVMCTSASATHWTFSTAFTPKYLQAGNGAHPINGNREFRIQETSKGHSFYTRASDRVNGLFEFGFNFGDLATGEGLVTWGQDHLWKSLQKGVAKFVNENGGKARIRPRTLKRFNWPEVRAYLNTRYCTVELDEAEDGSRTGCIRVAGNTGKLYRIRKGDTLLGVSGRAYGIGPGQERLRLAQRINAHPYNHRFWRKSGASPSFPQGRISFNPRFACNPFDQINVRSGAAPFGRCYATILIPPKPK